MMIRCHLLKSHPLPGWFQLIPSCREHMTSQYDRMCSLKRDECDYVNGCCRTARFLSWKTTQLSYLLRPRFQTNTFLGAFAKLRKATINIVMTVRPSACLGYLWTDFHEI